MACPSECPRELRKRPARMIAEVRPEYDFEWSAMKAVASKLGIGTTETLQKRVRQGQIDADARPGTTSEESAGEGERRAEAGGRHGGFKR